MHVMLIDNYSCPFVVTMTIDTIKGDLGPGIPAEMKRNMSMGQKTPGPLPM